MSWPYGAEVVFGQDITGLHILCNICLKPWGLTRVSCLIKGVYAEFLQNGEYLNFRGQVSETSKCLKHGHALLSEGKRHLANSAPS